MIHLSEVRQAAHEAVPALVITDLSIAFGGVHAVEGLSMQVPAGSIVALIGPNGAGKTTVLNGISGFVRARGSIRYETHELLRLPAHHRARLGIGRTFQNLQLFRGMTLLDNLMVGAHSVLSENIALEALRFPVRREEAQARDRALELLQRLSIAQYARRRVETLPFGVQKLAGVARALAARPRLLLLDEPAAGLNREESDRLGGLITGLRDEFGLAVLLVEHNLRLVMGISDRVVVLHQGRKLAEGSPPEIRAEPAVVTAYLGQAHGVPADVFDDEPSDGR